MKRYLFSGLMVLVILFGLSGCGRPAIIQASMDGNLPKIKEEVNNGADINTRNPWGMSSLHFAASKGHLNIAKYLVDKGININIVDDIKDTPLHEASMGGHLEIVKFLVKKDANVNIKSAIGKTPLHNASQFGHLEIVKFLVEKGANTNVSDNYKYTPLHYASSIGNLEITKFLVEKGANLNAKDSYGSTPLHKASSIGSLATVKFLFEKGAILNAKSTSNWTPLHSAALLGKLETVKLLVNLGIDTNIKNNKGATAYNLALEYKKYDVANYLLNAPRNIAVKPRNIEKKVVKKSVKSTSKPYSEYKITKENKLLIISTTQIDSYKSKNFMNNSYDIFRPTNESDKFLKVEGRFISGNPKNLKVKLIDKSNNIISPTFSSSVTTLKDGFTKLTWIFVVQKGDKEFKLQTSENEILAVKYITLKEKVDSYVKDQNLKELKELIDYDKNAINYIRNPKLRLYFVGPKELTIGKILNLKKKKMSDILILSQIKRVKEPYRNFSLTEMETLQNMGLSDTIIAEMINITTELEKKAEEDKKRSDYLSEQKKIANTKQKVVYKQPINNYNTNIHNHNQRTIGDKVMDKATDALIEKGAEMLLDQLF